MGCIFQRFLDILPAFDYRTSCPLRRESGRALRTSASEAMVDADLDTTELDKGLAALRQQDAALKAQAKAELLAQMSSGQDTQTQYIAQFGSVYSNMLGDQSGSSRSPFLDNLFGNLYADEGKGEYVSYNVSGENIKDGGRSAGLSGTCYFGENKTDPFSYGEQTTLSGLLDLAANDLDWLKARSEGGSWSKMGATFGLVGLGIAEIPLKAIESALSVDDSMQLGLGLLGASPLLFAGAKTYEAGTSIYETASDIYDQGIGDWWAGKTQGLQNYVDNNPDRALGNLIGTVGLTYLASKLSPSELSNINSADDLARLNQIKKSDFYVKANGETIPSTGYRYMSIDADYLDDLQRTMTIPANSKGTYISFDRYDTPSPKLLQVPHDAQVRGSFDTLQIIDDIQTPKGKWQTADWYEPITKDHPRYGQGGASQAVTKLKIKLDELIDMLKW